MSDPFENSAPREPALEKPGVWKTLLAVGAVLVVVAGGVFLYVATRPEPDFPDTAGVSVNGERGDEPVVGDCMRIDGNAVKATVTKVDCAAGAHNQVVASLQRQGEDCGSASGQEKTKYSRYRWSGKLGVCLAPVFEDGQCYRVTDLYGAYMPKAPCNELALKVRVFKDTADPAVCGPGVPEGLVYPEIRTTYCMAAYR